MARRDAGDGGLSFNATHGYWQGQYVVGHKLVPDPKQPGRMKKVSVRKTVTDKNKSECGRKLRRAMADWEAEQTRLVKTSATYTLQQCVEDWLAHELEIEDGLDPDTVARYRGQAAKWIFPSFGHLPVARMFAADFFAVLKAAAPCLGVASLRDLKSIMNQSVENAQHMSPPMLDQNYAKLADIPKAGHDRRRRFALNQGQVDQVLDVAGLGTCEHTMMALSFHMGMRPGEIRSLRWDHVQFDNPAGPVVLVWRSTGRGGALKNEQSKRSLKMSRLVCASLTAWKEAQKAGAELVVCRPDGEPYDKDALARFYGRVTKQAGLGELIPYLGRHTLVSTLSAGGFSSEQIAPMVGHANSFVTETVYKHDLHPVITDLADAIDAAYA